MEKLDPRLNVFRADLADEALRGRVEAQQFVTPTAARIAVSIAPIHKTPKPDAAQISQALFGEACEVFERQHDWAWVKMKRDGYVGYVQEQNLGVPTAPTHFVSNISTIFYAHTDLKSQPAQQLYLHSAVAVSRLQSAYACLATGGAVHAAHLSALGQHENDFVAVAERFLNVPYYWGGKTHAGLDCSGLVQIALQAAGVEAPRDSDMQEKNLGDVVSDHKKLKRGDLVFWRGHVGIMQSATQMIHANGHYMKVTSDLLQDVVGRSHTPISNIKRLGV
jgi:cell wall-associated NlpC family hydrolase